MSKTGGLGDNFYLGGYDLSGDIGALSKVGGGPALLEVTGIDKSGFERIGGLFSGEMDFTAWFNAAAAQVHAALSPLPTTDVDAMYCRGTALGSPAAFSRFKQVNYDMTRAQGGALSEAVQALSNAYPLFWGVLLTAGKRTDTAAGNGTGVDLGVDPTYTAVNITSVGVANPGQVNATAHGLVTGDSVVIAGTTTTPSINGNYPVTVVNANQFTIPVNVTSGQAGAAGTVTRTSANFGLTAMLQNFAFTGTSDTPKLQHSADDGSADAYADITGGGFSAISSAPTTQLLQTTTTRTIKRYIRLVTVGTFNPNTLAVAAMRHVNSTI
jgi:hypothetical protein